MSTERRFAVVTGVSGSIYFPENSIIQSSRQSDQSEKTFTAVLLSAVSLANIYSTLAYLAIIYLFHGYSSFLKLDL